jgi:hypothetical protein
MKDLKGGRGILDRIIEINKMGESLSGVAAVCDRR